MFYLAFMNFDCWLLLLLLYWIMVTATIIIICEIWYSIQFLHMNWIHVWFAVCAGNKMELGCTYDAKNSRIWSNVDKIVCDMNARFARVIHFLPLVHQYLVCILAVGPDQCVPSILCTYWIDRQFYWMEFTICGEKFRPNLLFTKLIGGAFVRIIRADRFEYFPTWEWFFVVGCITIQFIANIHFVFWR